MESASETSFLSTMNVISACAMACARVQANACGQAARITAVTGSMACDKVQELKKMQMGLSISVSGSEI